MKSHSLVKQGNRLAPSRQQSKQRFEPCATYKPRDAGAGQCVGPRQRWPCPPGRQEGRARAASCRVSFRRLHAFFGLGGLWRLDLLFPAALRRLLLGALGLVRGLRAVVGLLGSELVAPAVLLELTQRRWLLTWCNIEPFRNPNPPNPSFTFAGRLIERNPSRAVSRQASTSPRPSASRAQYLDTYQKTHSQIWA